jgi:hypothetical protein
MIYQIEINGVVYAWSVMTAVEYEFIESNCTIR